jgi:hypothetical protein
VTDLGRYFKGSIGLGVCGSLHRFQSSINSSRCSAAHSSTKAIARRGNVPRSTTKVAKQYHANTPGRQSGDCSSTAYTSGAQEVFGEELRSSL